MNNKGFTLIELLATVALLAVIVTISFISINSMIKQSKVNNCETIVNNLKSAASEYVSDNRYNKVFVDSIEHITVNGSETLKSSFNVDTLVNGNYLKGSIKNPFDNNPIEAKDIEISIELNNDYTLKSATITKPDVLVNCNG